MYAVRLFAVRHARFFETVYRVFERAVVGLVPVFEAVGYHRLERPTAATERLIKGILFDCRMCGQCVLSSTGMSCPMNCPKTLRNGPCGGVRDGGFCEVKPQMRGVWVESWEGAQRMRDGLCFVVHPWETGCDDSPRWDAWVGASDWVQETWLVVLRGLALF